MIDVAFYDSVEPLPKFSVASNRYRNHDVWLPLGDRTSADDVIVPYGVLWPPEIIPARIAEIPANEGRHRIPASG